ncbi:dihydrofolate reductase [Flavobacterium sp.]|uniref:dihydrofolate reductase n=1 Tax=Flavobacterium sp. TaxID=239 RepID=UPI00261B11C5|nr:dihydrofolate reductase [Flavobacterium sp.]
MKQIILIAAIGENRELGKNNDLLWHLPDDFKRFKTLTQEHDMIMGYKTFRSLPKLLPNRKHIVISSKKLTSDTDQLIYCGSLEEAVNYSKTNPTFVIGGGQIYNLSLAIADKLELTRVHGSFDAEVFFPEIPTNEFELVKSEFHPKDDKHAYSFTYETYIRTSR